MVDITFVQFAFSSGFAVLLAPCSIILIAAYLAFAANKKASANSHSLGKFINIVLKLVAGFGMIIVLTFLLIEINRMAFLIFEILAVIIGVLLVLWGMQNILGLKRLRALNYLEFPLVYGILYGIVSVTCLVPLFLFMDGTLVDSGLIGIISFIIILLIGSSLSFSALVFGGQLFQRLVQLFNFKHSYVRIGAALIVILSGLFIINFELTANGLIHLVGL